MCLIHQPAILIQDSTQTSEAAIFPNYTQPAIFNAIRLHKLN